MGVLSFRMWYRICVLNDCDKQYSIVDVVYLIYSTRQIS